MAWSRAWRSRAVAVPFDLALLFCGSLTLLLACSSANPQVESKPERTTGGAIYDKWCSDCHSRPTGSGTMALQRKYGGNPPAILTLRREVDPELVKLAVRQGISFMPSFRKTEISDAELVQLAAYVAHQPEPSVKSDKAPVTHSTAGKPE
jgi:(+)-pinoresinol hydroxylase